MKNRVQEGLARHYPTSDGKRSGTLFHVTDPTLLFRGGDDLGYLVRVDVEKPGAVHVGIMGARSLLSKATLDWSRANGEDWRQGGHHGGLSICVPWGDASLVDELAERIGSAGNPDAAMLVAELRQLAVRLRDIYAAQATE